jgi:arsenate reductase (thioredoxin)
MLRRLGLSPGLEMRRRRVLILCTGNSCRSQMAEGLVNHLLGDRWEAQSAGTQPAERVHPLAVRVMADAGIDISRGFPKPVGPALEQPWDLVVTVCDSARETCPVFPRPVPQVHESFLDPAQVEGSDDERLRVFRQVRDEIKERLLPMVASRS